MLGRQDLMSETPDIDWIIADVLPAANRALLYADSGVGKSFTALDIALHIATGLRWQGHAVKQGPVYYLAAENPDTFYGRVQAWEKQHRGFAQWEKSHPEEPDAPYCPPSTS
jgi:RecA-family ATPase